MSLRIVIVMVVLLSGAEALAQPPAAQPEKPPPPPPGWTGSFGAGLAQTQGNSDTSTINLAYDVLRDFGTPFVFKSTGLFIRGEAEGELTTDRLAFDGRVDRKLTERTSLFTQAQYLSDEFKQIDYLVSPTVGVAHFLVKNDRTQFGIDTGVGVVWEKNAGRDVDTDGAVTAGQNFKHRLTDTAEITQRTSALWKMNDFDDALYIFGAGLAANITTRTQVKIELLDTFKNRPPNPSVQKNDVAVLVSFVYKY